MKIEPRISKLFEQRKMNIFTTCDDYANEEDEMRIQVSIMCLKLRMMKMKIKSNEN